MEEIKNENVEAQVTEENVNTQLEVIEKESLLEKFGNFCVKKGSQARLKKQEMQEKHPVATKIAKGGAKAAAVLGVGGAVYYMVKNGISNEGYGMNYEEEGDYIDSTCVEVPYKTEENETIETE